MRNRLDAVWGELEKMGGEPGWLAQEFPVTWMPSMGQSLGSSECLGRYCAEARDDGRQRADGGVPVRSQMEVDEAEQVVG